ncbi:MAG: hypothetical protein HOK54_19060 [Alphaproteobacteria bacterium]|nr:hypothetical protein [Alphaproteobacteria bacterium]
MKPKSHQNVENSSPRVMIWLWPAVAVFMCGILASCVTGAARKLTGGDYAGAAKSSGGSYAEMSVENHYSVCAALLSLQRFSDVDQCMAPLMRRAYTETFDAGGGFGTYTKDYIDILLNGIEAKKFIALGNFDKAYLYAAKRPMRHRIATHGFC